MSKVLVTGISGFVGEHVAREFKSRGFYVVGVGHSQEIAAKVARLVDEYIHCDLVDEGSVMQNLSLADTSAIVHLAGLAAVGQSFDQPRRYLTENPLMTFNLLQKALDDKMPGRVVVVSSGALYDPAQPLPIAETARTNPNSPYAISKLTVEDVARYFSGRSLKTVIARPFNHIGPGQGPGFILPDLYEQLRQARTSGSLLVGNIDTRRDYTDVRDIAHAYYLLALGSALSHNIYNVCSGKSIAGREILRYLRESLHVSDIEPIVDPSRVRPADIADIYGDASRIIAELGWAPKIPVEQTIRDFVERKSSPLLG